MRTTITKELLEEAKAIGKSLRQLGRETGYCGSHLSQYCKKFGVQFPRFSSTPNIKGKKFGKLEVIERCYDEIRNDHRSVWLCRCECGNEIKKDLLALTKHWRCCGCSITPKGWKGVGKFPSSHWAGIVCMARNYKRDFNLTKEYLWNLYLEQNGRCALSNLEISFAKSSKTKSLRTASLDRIDSSQGYIIGNVQWVDKYVNKFKGSRDENNLIEYCRLVTEHKYNPQIYHNYISNFVIPNKHKRTGYMEISGIYWKSILERCNKKNMQCDISLEYIWNMFIEQKGRCKLSGLLLKFPKNKREDRKNSTASLDRIDSLQGYIKSNVQWVHKDINQMKLDQKEDYFIEICEKIYNHSLTKPHNVL